MDKDNTDINIILAQWKTCIEMANSVSQRRDTMNKIFTTLHIAILAVIFNNSYGKVIFIGVVGVALCYIWERFILNFQSLNEVKFKIINELEKSLPRQPFTEEWKSLGNNIAYTDGTKLETYLPRLFILIYILSGIFIAFAK